MLSLLVIKRFSEGDEIAFKQVYYYYYNSVFQLAKRILKQREKAEDVITDVFIAVWNKRHLFDNAEALKAYIWISTRNKCYSIKKNEGRRAGKMQHYVAEALHGEIFVDPEKGFKLFNEDAVLTLIYDIAENLTSSKRVTFYLYYSDGESAVAIAEYLNVTRQTVQYRLQDSIKFIKQKIRFLPYKIVWE